MTKKECNALIDKIKNVSMIESQSEEMKSLSSMVEWSYLYGKVTDIMIPILKAHIKPKNKKSKWIKAKDRKPNNNCEGLPCINHLGNLSIMHYSFDDSQWYASDSKYYCDSPPPKYWREPLKLPKSPKQ